MEFYFNSIDTFRKEYEIDEAFLSHHQTSLSHTQKIVALDQIYVHKLSERASMLLDNQLDENLCTANNMSKFYSML